MKSGQTGATTTFQTANSEGLFSYKQAEKITLLRSKGVLLKVPQEPTPKVQDSIFAVLHEAINAADLKHSSHRIPVVFCEELPRKYLVRKSDFTTPHAIALADYPERQSQKELYVDDVANGNLLITGSIQMGAHDVMLTFFLEKLVDSVDKVECIIIYKHEYVDNLIWQYTHLVEKIKIDDPESHEAMATVDSYLANLQKRGSYTQKNCIICIFDLDEMQYDSKYTWVEGLLKKTVHNTKNNHLMLIAHASKIQKIPSNALAVLQHRFALYEAEISDYFGFTKAYKELLRKEVLRGIYWDEAGATALQFRQFSEDWQEHQVVQRQLWEYRVKHQYHQQVALTVQTEQLQNINVYYYVTQQCMQKFCDDIPRRAEEIMLFFGSERTLAKQQQAEDIYCYSQVEQQVAVLRLLLKKQVQELSKHEIICIFYRLACSQLIQHLLGQQYLQQLFLQSTQMQIRVYIIEEIGQKEQGMLHPLQQWLKKSAQLKIIEGESVVE